MMKFLEGHPGLRWRLALGMLTIPLVIAGAIFVWQDHQARKDAIVTQVSLKSAEVNAQLEVFVYTVRGASGVFAQIWTNHHTPTSHNDPAEFNVMSSYLTKFVEETPHFSRASVTDAGGNIQVSSDPSIVGSRVGPDSLYQQARLGGEFTVSDVVVPADEEPAYALFVQPLKWSSGVSQGFLVLQSDLSTISGALDMSVGFPTTAKSGIFDSQGRILAGTGYVKPHPGLAAGRDISGSAVWAHASTRPTEEWFGLGLDKVDRIIFFGYPDSTPWVTTVAYAQSELFGPLWERLWIFGGALAATLLVIMWVAEIYIRRERRGVAALQRERLTLDAVMNGATDGILVIDTHNNVNFVNQRFSGMIGQDPSSLVGKPTDVVQTAMFGQDYEHDSVAIQLGSAMSADSNAFVDNWGRMAIVDTKPFKLRVILHRIFVERPQVTGIPAWPGGAACYRRSRYIL